MSSPNAPLLRTCPRVYSGASSDGTEDEDDVDKDEYDDAFDEEEGPPVAVSPDQVKAAEAAMKAQHDLLSMEWQVRCPSVRCPSVPCVGARGFALPCPAFPCPALH